MRKSFLSLLPICLLLGLVLAVGCGGGGSGGGGNPIGPVAESGIADLKGKVTYLEKPVANALVCLVKTAESPADLTRQASILTQPMPDYTQLASDGYRTVSDENGDYRFSQIPVGTYTLIAMIDPNIQVSRSVVLGAITDLNLALKPTGSISGTLMHAGKPMRGIVFLKGTSYMAVAGLDGQFKIMNVPVETTPYEMQCVVEQGEYAIQTFKVPQFVTPVAGVDTPLGNLELILAVAPVTGVALLPGATDNSGISVSTGEYYEGLDAVTDAAGKYSLAGVPFGNQFIFFSKQIGTETFIASTSILITSLATQTVPTVTLVPRSSVMSLVTVSIQGFTGSSDYVSYSLFNANYPSSPVQTGYFYSNGTSTYTLEPGTYYLELALPAAYSLANPAAGTTNRLSPITVAGGQSVTFAAQLTSTKANISVGLSGLTGSNGYVYYYLYNASGTQVGSNYSYSPGTWTYSLLAGSYHVRIATGSSQYTLMNPAAGTTNYLATVTVPISGNATFVAELQYNKVNLTISLAGLTGSSGSVYYYLYNSANPSSYVSSNNSQSPATFSVLVDPGSYYVRIATGSSYYNLLNPGEGTTNTLATITVPLGGSGSFLAQLEYNRANLSGTISGINANFPVPTAYLYPGGLSTTLSSGNYAFTGVTPGVYSLFVSSPGYDAASTAVTLLVGSNNLNVTLTPNFPIVTAVSYASPLITVTGDRFDVSTASLYVDSTPYTPGSRATTQMTFDASGWTPGVYTVYARGSDGAVSVNSGNITIPFVSGPTILAGTVGTSSYTLNWNPVSGAEGYEVSGTGISSVTLGLENTYTFTGLTPNKPYTFFVRATCTGLSPSPSSATTITTGKVYKTPVVLDTLISFDTFRGSQVKSGVLFAVIEQPPGTFNLVRYNLTTMATATVSLTPPSGQTFETLHVDTDVYIGWKGGNQVTLQQFTAATLSLANSWTGTFTGSYGQAYGLRVITDPTQASTLKILSWGFEGEVGTFVASYTTLNTNLAGAVNTPAPLTYVGLDSFGKSYLQWIPVKGSDGNTYFAMSYQGSGGAEFKVFDTANNLIDSASLSALNDLSASPISGMLLIDSARSYFMKPPSFFGGFSFSTSGFGSTPQGVIDNAGRFYFYQKGTLSTLHRYSASGALLDASDFRGGVTPVFGEECLTYDPTTNQVLIAQKTAGGTLGFTAFTTLE